MKNLKLIIICLAAMLTLSNCKKYEDGNNLSIRTKKHRVVGDWDVKNYSINGTSQLQWSNYDYLISACTTVVSYTEQTNYTEFVWSFEDNRVNRHSYQNYDYIDSNSSYTNCYAVFNSGVNYESNSGNWNFSSNKQQLQILWDNNASETFNIIELRENRMKLKQAKGNDIIEILLVKRD